MNAPGAAPIPNRTHETGLLVFLATVAMLFTAFAAAYLVRRAGADWKPSPLPNTLWASTVALLAAGAAIEWGRRRMSRPALLLAGALGVLFAGLQLLAWDSMTSPGPYRSFFQVITAAHGLHLLGGLACLPWVILRPTPQSIRLTAIYWHFLAIVWIAMFALMGLL